MLNKKRANRQKPEPDPPVIVLRRDCIRLTLTKDVVEIRLPSEEVLTFPREQVHKAN